MINWLDGLSRTDLGIHMSALVIAAVAHVRDGIVDDDRIEQTIALLQSARLYAREAERRERSNGEG